MASPSWLLFQHDRLWQIAKITSGEVEIHSTDLETDASSEEIAQGLAEHFQTLGYHGEGLMWGIDSSKCLVGHVSIDDPALMRNHQAMRYQLEQWLPVAAEDFVADFVYHGQEVLGVAVKIARVTPLIDALESAGIRVQSIVPFTLLALQGWLDGSSSDDARLILLGQGDHVDWFMIRGGKPSDWQHMPAALDSLTKNLEFESLSHSEPLTVESTGLDPEWNRVLSQHPDVLLQDGNKEEPAEAAAFMAERILLGQDDAWVELRRDALAPQDSYRLVRGPLRLAVATAMLFLIVLSVGFEYRASQYRQREVRGREQQEAVFSKAVPGQPTTGVIRLALTREKEKMAGMKGATDDLPDRMSALFVIHEVLLALPEDLRYRFDKIQIINGQIWLDSDLRSHGDASVLAKALEARGFHVATPRTDQSSQGISVYMNATWRNKKQNVR